MGDPTSQRKPRLESDDSGVPSNAPDGLEQARVPGPLHHGVGDRSDEAEGRADGCKRLSTRAASTGEEKHPSLGRGGFFKYKKTPVAL